MLMPCHCKHELHKAAGTETPQKPIETPRVANVINKGTLFRPLSTKSPLTDRHVFSKFTPQTTCSYLGCSKSELSRFSVVSVLTFQSHQDDNLFPGCTLASVTIPAVSFIRSVFPTWFGHFFCDKHVDLEFIFYSVRYYRVWSDRVGLPQIVQGGRGISKERTDSLRTSNSLREWAVTTERM